MVKLFNTFFYLLMSLLLLKCVVVIILLRWTLPGHGQPSLTFRHYICFLPLLSLASYTLSLKIVMYFKQTQCLFQTNNQMKKLNNKDYILKILGNLKN